MAAIAQDFPARAAAHAESWARSGEFRGAILCAVDGKPVFRRAYGWANSEWEIPNTPETKFRLGSITKQFTAAAILAHVEKGKLSLEDPIGRHGLNLPEAWNQVTVRQLLNHTSGIPSYTSQRDFFPKQSRDRRTPAEIIQLTAHLPLEFPPGTEFRYNNTGYIILGALLEKLTGGPYADWLQKNIFGPLEMKNSGYDDPRRVISRRASGYAPDGSNAAYLDMSLPYAAGSLYSTVDDLLQWSEALAGGQVISKESYALMTTAGLGEYGLGLWMRKVGGRLGQGHGGGINGFTTFMARFPAEKFTVIVLSNQEGPGADRLAGDLAKLFFGEDVAPRAAVTWPDAQIDEVAGRYEIGPNFVLRVWREGSRILTQATNQRAIEVFPRDGSRAFAKVMEAELEFQRDASGKVTGLIIHQGGRATPARRLPD